MKLPVLLIMITNTLKNPFNIIAIINFPGIQRLWEAWCLVYENLEDEQCDARFYME